MEFFADQFDFESIRLTEDQHRAIAEGLEQLNEAAHALEPSVVRDNLQLGIEKIFYTMLAAGSGHTSRKVGA